MGTGTQPVSLGITFGAAKNIHLEALYNVRNSVNSVILTAASSGNPINYDVIFALVEHAISLIPDTEQGNKCRKKLYIWQKEECENLTKERKHEAPTSEDIEDSKRQAAFATLQLVQEIFDDDIGIRKLHTVGVA